MNRRAFLFLSSSIAIPLSSQPVSSPRNWSRSFQLPLIAQDFVQHCHGSVDGLDCVVFNRSSLNSKLISTSLTGSVKFSGNLPAGILYSGLGVRSSGEFVMPCIERKVGVQIREFTKAGIQARQSDIQNGSGIHGYCVVGDTLAILRESGGVDLLDLGSRRTRSFGKLVEEPRVAVMYPGLDGNLLIVDRAQVRLCVMSLADGSAKFASINNRDILLSKQFFSQKLQTQETQGTAKATPLVITPSLPAADGSLYCIVYPVRKPEGALVQNISISGEMTGAFRIVLPDLNGRLALPDYLYAFNQELFAIFSTGEVRVYQL